MNVGPTEVKSELVHIAKGSESEAKLRIRRYLQHVGFTPGCVKDLPRTSTSEICLDSELLFYLISVNDFEKSQQDVSLAPETTSLSNIRQPRKIKLFSSIYFKIKRILLNNYRGHQRFSKKSLTAQQESSCDELDKKSGIVDLESDDDDDDDSCPGGSSPSSVRTVIQSDNVVMITPPGFPTDPNPTTNILKVI